MVTLTTINDNNIGLLDDSRLGSQQWRLLASLSPTLQQVVSPISRLQNSFDIVFRLSSKFLICWICILHQGLALYIQQLCITKSVDDTNRASVKRYFFWASMLMSCDTRNISEILYNGIFGPCFNSYWLFLGKLKKKIPKRYCILYCVAMLRLK